jgi:hypothetical protein
MNKYEQAFSEIMLSTLYDVDISKQYKIIKKLVERTILKKTIPRYFITMPSNLEEYGGADCPVCGLFLEDEYQYCPDCGQALDWSDEL